ncbi:MAG: holo-ACP synthase [Candidatus Nanopelagicales bacterium]
MIVGIGTDIVDVERFKWMMRRTPAVLDRLFSDAEKQRPDGASLSAESLAGRFAVKEAVAKALGCPPGLEWHDCLVESSAGGAPKLLVEGTVAAACAERGITDWHVTISHDGGMSTAFVVAEAAGLADEPTPATE